MCFPTYEHTSNPPIAEPVHIHAGPQAPSALTSERCAHHEGVARLLPQAPAFSVHGPGRTCEDGDESRDGSIKPNKRFGSHRWFR